MSRHVRAPSFKIRTSEVLHEEVSGSRELLIVIAEGNNAYGTSEQGHS